jgi:SulP family sulfate permease
MRINVSLDTSHLRGDFFGGLTAGIVALPLALAFGAQTELGAIAGLYGAIAIGILAAIFGGTPVQISGPTAPMTVVSAVIIADAVHYAGGLEAAFPIIIATFFLAGLMQMGMGLSGIGRYIKYIPYPVVSGFMSGIGAIIIISQIFPFFGASTPGGGPLGVIGHLGALPALINWQAMLLAAATVFIIYYLPRYTKILPSSLVALIVLSGSAFLLFAPGQVAVINDGTPGGVPVGLPKLHLNFLPVLSDFKHLGLVLEYALTLAALGAIDSLLTSIVADNVTKTKHDSNRELLGQGIGNMGAAILGGLPGAGATMRTIVNINAGGRTRLSGVFAGLLLLAVLLGLGALVGNIPNAVLAGILVTVGIGIIDYKGLRHLAAIPRADAVIMIVVFLMTVFVGLLEAVAVGMLLAALLFMKNISDIIERKTQTTSIQAFAHELPWSDEEDVDLTAFDGQVYIKHLDGPLFFGFASRFQEMVKSLPVMQMAVIRMDRVPYIDQSGLYALEEGIRGLHALGIIVAITGLHGQPKEMLRRIKLAPGLVAERHCFESFPTCALWLRENLPPSPLKMAEAAAAPLESKVTE